MSETTEKVTERRPLPKEAFDSEYQTEWLREMRFLGEKGIRYTFVRKTPDYGVSQFKYKKTPALFAALVEFYSMIEAEKNARRKMKKEEPTEKVILSPEEIKRAQEILERAVKQSITTTETPAEKDDTI